MAVRPIVRLGHPALRAPARPIAPDDVGSPAIQGLIDDMVETMHESHGVGLAAPQVGVGLQVFVYEASSEARGGEEAIPLRVAINPMLTPQPGNMVQAWEGCLSIPDLRGLVPRHPAVRLRGLDREGRPLDVLVKDFEARIVQHEHDHLNGVVFLDRMRDFKSLAFYREWEEYLAEGGDEQGQIAADPLREAETAPAGREPG